ncbi:uncharacterized protein B0I36DRAFT_120121 [Microdochium trichocladiopsis]|uniref:Uncharacterized protein n=1 Tax=Microdochium trichocladiopsis TaxID=1682393 RepID=A0A9P8Y938_9PEZI|nr:uncharacterized protein B0I36DRAFT_120121 [Microdochium trichocladiopsis]KAH7031221.1 hypothetical protein B0I36DRAFT_120121 [Microdochium trichocladiopsis]
MERTAPPRTRRTDREGAVCVWGRASGLDWLNQDSTTGEPWLGRHLLGQQATDSQSFSIAFTRFHLFQLVKKPGQMTAGKSIFMVTYTWTTCRCHCCCRCWCCCCCVCSWSHHDEHVQSQLRDGSLGGHMESPQSARDTRAGDIEGQWLAHRYYTRVGP